MKHSDEILVRTVRLTPSGPRDWSPSMGTNRLLPGSPANGKFEPTQAVPGSEMKLQVLEQRRAAGLPLFHPADRVNREELERLDQEFSDPEDELDRAELDEFHDEFEDDEP